MILSVLIIILTYSKTTIREFSILDIKLTLKEDYLISEFNTFFIIALIYYFYLMICEISDLYRKGYFKEIKKEFEKTKSLSNYYSLPNKSVILSGEIFISSWFLNLFLPLIISGLTISYSIFGNFFIVHVISTIILFILSYFLFMKKIPKKLLLKKEDLTNKAIAHDEANLKIKKAYEKIDKKILHDDEKVLRIFEMAIKTNEERRRKIEKEIEEL